MSAKRAPRGVRIGTTEVAPGEVRNVNLQVARLFTGDWLTLPVKVVCGAKPGPRLWMNAALHGDELNGMEIIRRVLERVEPRRLSGTVVAAPVVNVFGFIQQARYLPDRRDLNRSFPGSVRGSLASRLARLFVDEVVANCDYGLDFHTGSLHRTNIAQIRADLDDPKLRRLAEAFAAPVMVKAKLRPGSLRAFAQRHRIPMLVFEGGEPLRFNEDVIGAGVGGSLRVMAHLGMRRGGRLKSPRPCAELTESSWVRASRSGIFRLAVGLGERVEERAPVGRIGDVFGGPERPIKAPFSGLVIGHTNNPLVSRGDALVHLGQTDRAASRKKPRRVEKGARR